MVQISNGTHLALAIQKFDMIQMVCFPTDKRKGHGPVKGRCKRGPVDSGLLAAVAPAPPALAGGGEASGVPTVAWPVPGVRSSEARMSRRGGRMSREEAELAKVLALSADGDTSEVTSVETGEDGQSVTRVQMDPVVLELAKQSDFMDKSMKTIREEISQKLGGADLSSKPAKAMVKVHAAPLLPSPPWPRSRAYRLPARAWPCCMVCSKRWRRR